MGREAAVRAAGLAAMLALPALLTVFFAFEDGGFFPGTVAIGVIVIAQVLVLRVTLAEHPARGLRPLAFVPIVGLSLLGLLALLSSRWSDATSRALIEADRILLYVLVLALFASLGHRATYLRWILRGVLAAIVVVCAVALAPRLFPGTFPLEPQVFDERLSWPLTYWNALGLLAGIAMVFALHVSSSRAEHPAGRVAAAGVLPLLAVTIYFTFSRGALLVTLIAVALYVLLAFSPGLLATLVATGPPTVVAVMSAYGAELLGEPDRTGAAALAQADDVARTLILCVLAAAALRLAAHAVGARLPAPLRSAETARRVTVIGLATIVVLGVGVGVAVNAPGAAVDAADRFLESEDNPEGQNPDDIRDRFTAAESPGRIDHWRIALDVFDRETLHGSGAGTYALEWARDSEIETGSISDAHSLYLETMAEYGLPGLVLLVASLAAILAAFAAGLRGRDRRLYAALLASGCAWVLHAGLDWDWEMPATALWLFALGGVAIAGRPQEAAKPPGNTPRLLVALSCLVLVAGPYLIVTSEQKLDQAIGAFYANDCAEVRDLALDGIDTLGSRPEPYQLLGYCASLERAPLTGVDAMREAVERDPDSWEPHIGLALLQAQAGQDPRPEARTALALRPRYALLRDAAEAMEGGSEATWPDLGIEHQNRLLSAEGLAITRGG